MSWDRPRDPGTLFRILFRHLLVTFVAVIAVESHLFRGVHREILRDDLPRIAHDLNQSRDIRPIGAVREERVRFSRLPGTPRSSNPMDVILKVVQREFVVYHSRNAFNVLRGEGQEKMSKNQY